MPKKEESIVTEKELERTITDTVSWISYKERRLQKGKKSRQRSTSKKYSTPDEFNNHQI